MMAKHNGEMMSDSFVVGPTDLPLLDKTIGHALDEAASLWRDNEALVVPHQGVRWSWGQLAAKVDTLAMALLRLGFEKGDRLGIWATNLSEWTLTQLAAAKIGVILVNINPAYRPGELDYVLNKVGCAGLVTGVRFKSSDYIEMLNGLLPELKTCEPGKLAAKRAPALHTIIRLGDETTPGMFSFDEVLGLGSDCDRSDLVRAAASLESHDAINIQFTSGTTGAPKGATLSHYNILNNARFIGRILRFTTRDRICVPVPLYHCFGMVGGTTVALTCGATVVYPAEAFEPERVLRTIENERCTALYGVPTMFAAMLEHEEFASRDVSSLRTGIMAGAPCPVELMKQTVSRFHMPEITIAYGMTETSPVSFQSDVEDPVQKRVGTVGRIHPHARAKIVDQDGHIVARGVQGEILTAGYLVMQGYWDDAAKTAEAIDNDGWMHTGDLGTLDEDGWLRITGRVKDMVIRGGENIYPREIEEYLYQHPKIVEAQVFGVPDDRYGEELAVWIRLRDGELATEEEIRDFCSGKIAHYKIPRYIRFVDEFPMTVTGKIQKFEMRRIMRELLDLQEQETA